MEMLSHRKKTPHTSLCVSLAHVDPVCPQRPARTWPLSFPGSGSYTGPIACPSLNSFPEHHENSSSLMEMTPGWHMASFSQQILSPSPAYEGGNPKAPTFFFFPTLASVCPTLGFTSSSPTMPSFAPPHLPKPSRNICLPTSASFASTCVLSLSFTLPHPCYIPPFRFFLFLTVPPVLTFTMTLLTRGFLPCAQPMSGRTLGPWSWGQNLGIRNITRAFS